MPFTVAHAAAALPIKKLFPRLFSLTGLMAGAVAPDLLYFLTLTTMRRGDSHSWTGLFLFCLPAGVAFAFAIHWLVKGSVLVHLPSPWDRRFSGLAASRFRPDSVGDWRKLVVSVGVGVLTHFLWDSFTHSHGQLAGILPYLQEKVWLFGGWVPVTNFIRIGSNVVAFVALWWAFRGDMFLPRPVTGGPLRTSREKWRFWIGMGGFATVFAVVSTLVQVSFFPERVENWVVAFGLSGWAGFFWGVAGYGAWRRVRGDRREAAEELREERVGA